MTKKRKSLLGQRIAHKIGHLLIKQSKTRGGNLKVDFSIAKLCPILSKPRDNGRKRGSLGFNIHESLTHKRKDHERDFECALVKFCFNYN